MTLHGYKCIDMSLYVHRTMASQSHNAHRVEGSAGSRQSMDVSQASHDFTPSPTPMTGTLEYGLRSRSKDFNKLQQLGAKDFNGTTDPTEAETWLKRTERIFTLLRCSREDQFDFIVSLLQGDAYDWWETVPGATERPPILTYEDFLREFRDRYMPEFY